MSDLIGQTLGQYQIVEQIGMGGMATVYKAYQASMDRFVAIKVLPRQLAEDPSFMGRFEQEARTIANLENKNILPVYDYGEHGGHTYLVMRYVGYGTLKDLTIKGALSLADSVKYLAQIAEALHYAHERGVVHRDVKTSNVLIDADGQCYLTDFGIAKLAAGSSHFTASGAIVGTPAYMSPEQCSGLPADARSDIYALGIVLYEMLTGAVPFEAETPVAVVLMHVQTPLPSPRKLNPNIPEPVEQVVFRALAKKPDERYQSAADFNTALQAAFASATDQRTASMPLPQSLAEMATIPPSSAPDTRPGAPTTPPSADTVAAAQSAKRPRWHYALGIAALLVIALIIVGVLSEDDSGAADEVAAVPTDTATPLPTDTPEPTVTQTPTPTERPIDIGISGISEDRATNEIVIELFEIDDSRIASYELQLRNQNGLVIGEYVHTPPPFEVRVPLATLTAGDYTVVLRALGPGGTQLKETVLSFAYNPPATPTPPPTPTYTPEPTPTEVATLPEDVQPEDAGWTVYTSTQGDGPGTRQIVTHPVTGVWMGSPGGLVHYAPNGMRTVYTSADGLAFNGISTLAFDAVGDLWLAGGDDAPGIMRVTLSEAGTLDTIDYFTRDNSRLRAQYVYALFPLPDGTMLIGTDYTSYIELWTGDQWDIPAFRTRDTSLQEVGDQVWHLLVTRTGGVWAAGPRGLAVLADGADDWLVVPPPAALVSDDIEAYNYYLVYPDLVTDSLWVGIYTEPDWEQHLLRLTRNARSGALEWQPVPEEVVLPEEVREIYRADDESLWVLGYDTLAVYRRGERPVTFSSDDGIVGGDYLDLAQDDSGAFWLSTTTALMHFDERRWGKIVDEADAPFNSAVAMAEDDTSATWFLSNYGTLAVLREGQWEVLDTLDMETYDMVLHHDAVWIASEYGVIRWADGAYEHITTEDGLTEDTVYRLAVDPHNADLLWAGTYDGLNLINMDNLNILSWTYADGELPGPMVTLIHVDYERNDVWIGTGAHYDNENDEVIGAAALLKVTDPRQPAEWIVVAERDDPFDQDDWHVTALVTTESGDLWLGTDVRTYHQEDGRWQRFGDDQGGPEWTEIRALTMQGNILWAGTDYYGLYLYDARGWYRLGSEGTGSNTVYGLYQARDGALWVLAEHSITRMMGNPLLFD